MRPAFVVALALSLSFSVVKADETPEVALYGVSSVDPAPATAPATAVSEAAVIMDGPKTSAAKVCVMLRADSFEIRTGKSPRPQTADPTVYLICDNVTTTSDAGGATTVKCTQCEVTLPNGVSATASDVAFDSKANSLILTGSDEAPVTVTMAGAESKAAKVEMKFDFPAWPVAAPAPSLAPASYNSPIPAYGKPSQSSLTPKY